MEIRKSTFEDFDRLMEIYEKGRAFMRAHGNMEQWSNGDGPTEVTLKSDIENGTSYAAVVDGIVQGTFYMAQGPDPCYGVIYDGQWPNEENYVVLHRVCSSGEVPGVGKFCLNWAAEHYDNVRIDTHRDNYPMQNLVTSQGFSYCGIIHMENGDERLAYQRVRG